MNKECCGKCLKTYMGKADTYGCYNPACECHSVPSKAEPLDFNKINGLADPRIKSYGGAPTDTNGDYDINKRMGELHDEIEDINGDWRDIETLSAKIHDIYQAEAKRQGDVRHKDAYADLTENVKEFDRVLARFIAKEIESSETQAMLRQRHYDQTLIEKAAEAGRAAAFKEVRELIEKRKGIDNDCSHGPSDSCDSNCTFQTEIKAENRVLSDLLNQLEELNK